MNWGRCETQRHRSMSKMDNENCRKGRRCSKACVRTLWIVVAEPVHIPVMQDQILDLLGPAISDKPAALVDATLGLAGHAEAFLARFPQLRLIGIDRDPAALEFARKRLQPYAERCHFVQAIYHTIPEVLAQCGFVHADAVLFDLGVSSMQLDLPERGFSYARDAPLDMRMGSDTSLTADEIVNTYSVAELTRVLRDYGEERFAHRIALAIEQQRSKDRITSTAQLADLVRNAIPAATRKTGGHPAKRTFQALRIEVNGELEIVQQAIPAALGVLPVGGRIAVLSYHSLEDRIVKHAIGELTRDNTPVGLPVNLPSAGPQLRSLTRGAQTPTAAEMATNPRATSAKLRAAERIREAA